MQKEKISLIYFILVIAGFFILTSPTICFPQQEPNNQIKAANKALEEGKYQEAIKIYSSILQDNPDNFAVRARLARSYYLFSNENKDYLYRAAKEYHNLTQKKPDFSLPYLELGQIAYLLALESEAKDEKKNAQDLYKSSLAWFSKYIQLEKKEETLDSQKEISVTKVLQAIIYTRMGEKDEAFRLVEEAKKDYNLLLSKKKEFISIYDYFVRSGVEYINAKLYNQALIYLEGAWLIEPRPQVRTLLENVIKARGISISPLESIAKKEKEIQTTSPEVSEEKIEKLNSQLQNLSKRLESLSSLKGEVKNLERQVKELLELKVEVDKLKAEVRRLSQREDGKIDQQKTGEYFDRISQLNERVNILYKKIEALSQLQDKIQDLEKKIDQLDSKLNTIKSATDKFGVLKIQLQELRKAIQELERKILQKEETETKKEKTGE